MHKSLPEKSSNLLGMATDNSSNHIVALYNCYKNSLFPKVTSLWNAQTKEALASSSLSSFKKTILSPFYSYYYGI